MNMKEVRSALEVIYLELDHSGPEDEQRLAEIRDQIGQVIAGLPDGETPEDDLSPSDQLRSAVTRFESEHPRLARATEEVIDALSRMGI
ncbi:MAG: DUF4404 family protein [Pseudomonadota bacterium]